MAGAVQADDEFGARVQVLLVGNRQLILDELTRQEQPLDRFEIIHAPEAVEMGESGAKSVRRKRNSSLAVAAKMMQSGDADALVSAGNTAAVVSTALVGLGRMPGVLRPAIASVLPTQNKGHCVLLDVGATADCKPEYLVQFAIMGSLYAQIALDIAEPRVGLLNIGEEPGKGNELARASLQLLEEAPVCFAGNVEGRDVFRGAVDVVVCDGFVGNVILKFAESLVETLVHMLRTELKGDLVGKIGAGLTRPAMRRLFRSLDYAEYGGAPLMGVNGGCIICHGSSSVRAIKNAVRVATHFVEVDLGRRIVEQLQKGQAHG